VTALQGLVTKLQQQVDRDELVIACGFATQASYNIANLDLWATLLGLPTYSGPAPNDGGACAKLGLPAPSERSLSSHSPLGALEGVLRNQVRLTPAH
jgi:hypothetical protein